jgi:hypothetical protein
MNEENQLTEQQSLDIITNMISKAKDDYTDTGVAALMWGVLISFCSLITFGNNYWKIDALNYIWFLTLIAVIPQSIISIRESKRKRFKTYNDDAMGGIWISFAIALFLISVYAGKYQLPNEGALFLIMYGIPTFATGFTRRFKPMIIGGIVCWLFAIICFYVQFPYIMLYTAAAAIIAWFIPGLILRKRYIKAKAKNV